MKTQWNKWTEQYNERQRTANDMNSVESVVEQCRPSMIVALVVDCC